MVWRELEIECSQFLLEASRLSLVNSSLRFVADRQSSGTVSDSLIVIRVSQLDRLVNEAKLIRLGPGVEIMVVEIVYVHQYSKTMKDSLAMIQLYYKRKLCILK